MRPLFRYLLAPFTLGITLMGCGGADPEPQPADVVLHVPGMY